MNNSPKKFKYSLDPVTGTLTEDSARQYFSRFGWFAFTFFLVYMAVSNIIYLVTLKLAPSIANHYLFSEMLSFVPFYCFAVPIAYIIIRPLPTEKPMKAKMGFGKWMIGLCISITLLMAGNYISQWMMLTIEMVRGSSPDNPLVNAIQSMPTWLNVLAVGILAPILEELFFRKLVCTKLLVLGEGFAVFLSAAFFALMHGNFYQLFYTFILGCFFGFIFVKTGKIIYTIAYHIAINMLGGVISPIILKYIDIDALLAGNVEAVYSNIRPIMALLVYELVMLVGSIVGIIFIINKRREFRLNSGILPPPKKGRAGMIMLNAGVAAAVALFSIQLVLSLMY